MIVISFGTSHLWYAELTGNNIIKKLWVEKGSCSNTLGESYNKPASKNVIKDLHQL